MDHTNSMAIRPFQLISRSVLLAVVYAVAGILSLRLIESPTTLGSPFWPSAGIALASLLIWGRRLGLGVLIGATIVQLSIAYDWDEDITRRDFVISSILGLGAMIQAVVGVGILRRVMGPSFLAIRSRDIWVFLMVSGPVICVINATLSVIFLVLIGSISQQLAFGNWFAWWLGDSIGALIFFTIMLTLWGTPHDVWRSRRVSVGVTLAILAVTLVGYFAIVRSLERDRIETKLDYLIPIAHSSLKGWYENAGVAIKTWRGRHGDFMTEPLTEQHKLYINQYLNYHDTVHSFGTALLVQQSERADFEKTTLASDGKPVQITDRINAGELFRAPKRDRYYSVNSYITRTDKDPTLFGYDFGSNPLQLEAIETAIRQNKIVASSELSPFNQPDKRLVLMFMPIYHVEQPIQTPEQRVQALRAIAFVVYDIDVIHSRAFRSQLLPAKELTVNMTESAAPTLIPAPAPGVKGQSNTPKTKLHWTRVNASMSLPIEVGMKQYDVKYEVGTTFLHRDQTSYLDLMRLFWLFITMLVVAVQLLISGRMFVVEGEVQQRTVDLRQEISERTRAESELRTVRSSLEDAEAQASLGSWERDLKTGEAWWSRQQYRTYAYNSELPPPTYEEVLQMLHPDDRALAMATRNRVITTGQSESLEVRTNPESGPIRYLNSTWRLIRDANGQPSRIAGTVQDVTARKLLEDDLRQARDDLERRVNERTVELVQTNDALRLEMEEREKVEAQFRQAQKMEILGQLAGGVAHDFNNLLTVICGYGEMLLTMNELSPTSREWAGEIFHTGQRATLLTRQLLAFSRNQVIEPKILDINEIVRNSEKLSLRLVGENIRIKMTLAPRPLCVRGDTNQMEQILLNLAVNARDAMPHGGCITVETRNVNVNENNAQLHPVPLPGPYVVLSVSDTGCGMTPEVQAKIFEPFFTTKAPGKGTGLGLATVFGIVKQAGGGITVNSVVDQGTTFRIYLPQKYNEATSEGSQFSKAMPRGTETILLAEDEESVRLLARQILETCGYKLLVASDGQKALELASQHTGHIDLLISDIVMPNLGGRELVERIKVDRPDVKLLYVSGYADDDSLRQNIAAEDIPFMNKPFTVTQLAQKVRYVLDKGKT